MGNACRKKNFRKKDPEIRINEADPNKLPNHTKQRTEEKIMVVNGKADTNNTQFKYFNHNTLENPLKFPETKKNSK